MEGGCVRSKYKVGVKSVACGIIMEVRIYFS